VLKVLYGGPTTFEYRGRRSPGRGNRNIRVEGNTTVRKRKAERPKRIGGGVPEVEQGGELFVQLQDGKVFIRSIRTGA